MKNKEIYKSIDEQNEAFKQYCSEAVDSCEGRGCLKCVLSWLEADVDCDNLTEISQAETSSITEPTDASQNITRIFRESHIKYQKVRQHPDGRISIFFSENTELHTIYLKSDNLNRSILARQIKKPVEISDMSLYTWHYWEEV